MNKRLIGIIGMSLFFLTGCGEEEPVRVPDPTEQRKVKAEIFNKADNIGKQDIITITGSVPDKTRYKQYTSTDLGISFSILSYQEDPLFQPAEEIHINIERKNNKVSLKKEENKATSENIPSIEIFQKETNEYVNTFIQRNFLKGKDKDCKIQLQETFQKYTDQVVYRRRSIIYKNMNNLPICEDEFCTAEMFCGPYAQKETNSYFLSTETGNTIIFLNAGEEPIIGTSEENWEDTIHIK